jgi:hypothetical protein
MEFYKHMNPDIYVLYKAMKQINQQVDDEYDSEDEEESDSEDDEEEYDCEEESGN